MRKTELGENKELRLSHFSRDIALPLFQFSQLREGLGAIVWLPRKQVTSSGSNMANKYDLLLVQTKTDDKKRLKPWYVNTSVVRSNP